MYLLSHQLPGHRSCLRYNKIKKGTNGDALLASAQVLSIELKVPQYGQLHVHIKLLLIYCHLKVELLPPYACCLLPYTSHMKKMEQWINLMKSTGANATPMENFCSIL